MSNECDCKECSLIDRNRELIKENNKMLHLLSKWLKEFPNGYNEIRIPTRDLLKELLK